MAFILKSGKTKTVKAPWTTGQTISKGSLVVWSSGRLIPATSSTESYATLGVIQETITSASDVYTTNGEVLVEVPIQKDVKWTADFTTTLLVTDIGAHCDLTNAYTVNRGASSLDICEIAGFISATKGIVVLNIGPGAIKGQA
jgi:hypothetical protein